VVEAVRVAGRYGLDTEFHREHTYWPELALVQLAWDGGLALVDPLGCSLEPLGELFCSDAEAVLHAAEQDLLALGHVVGAAPRRLVDTQILSAFLGWSQPGLGVLTQHYLGQPLAKAERLTDWMQRPLTPAQVAYAADDVRFLLPLVDRLEAEVGRRGRTAWAHEECERLRTRSAAGDVRELWWRVRDARRLRGRARGIAQEVVIWREKTAARLNRPVRRVLSDQAVITLAERAPADVAALRRLGLADARALAPADEVSLVAAVARGRMLRAEELCLPPGEPSDPVVRRQVAFDLLWLQARADELGLDPSLLGTRHDVVELVTGAASRLGEGWRADAIGGGLRAAGCGASAVALDGRGLLRTVDVDPPAVSAGAPDPLADRDARAVRPELPATGESAPAPGTASIRSLPEG
jgi:ribonuclease D